MPSITIIHEFNLPEEREEYNTMMNAGAYLCALTEMSETFRSAYKYGVSGDVEFGEHECKTIEKLRDLFHGILIDNEVDV